MKRMTDAQHYWMMFALGASAGFSVAIGAIMQMQDGSWPGFLLDSARMFGLLASCIVGWAVLFVLTKPEETK